MACLRILRLKLCYNHHWQSTAAIASVLVKTTANIGTRHDHSRREYKSHHNKSSKITPSQLFGGTALAFSFNLFQALSSDDEEETPENKLITTIKQSVLCIQQQKYEKAEQTLHLALRMAQDLQNANGILYVYDVMANLALERHQLLKAQKLFTEVMRRLFDSGHGEDSLKVLHVSAKLANIQYLQGEFEKALLGFNWTIKKLEEVLAKAPGNVDAQGLWGLTKNWFGQLLMKKHKFMEAKRHFEEALQCLTELHGVTEDAITIMNNISVAYIHMDDTRAAKETLLKAIALLEQLKDTSQEGILHANLGLVYLHDGLLAEAERACSFAWRTATKAKNLDAVEQAEYCLNEVKTFKQ